MFESKEVIEEVQRAPAKAVSPVETPEVSESTDEQQTPKVSAPTPEQIIAIKVSELVKCLSLFTKWVDHVPCTSCLI